MERSKALAMLGLTEGASRDEMHEALDHSVFKVRDHLMRHPVVPPLVNQKVEKCLQLSDVAQTLGLEALGAAFRLPSLMPHGNSLEALVHGHVENLRRCRNVLATTLDPDAVAQVGHVLTRLQVDYMNTFLAYTREMPKPDGMPSVIAAKEEADWMALLAAIRAEGQGKGNLALLQDLVARERIRMIGMLKTAEQSPR